jgi:hypothetical protein
MSDPAQGEFRRDERLTNAMPTTAKAPSPELSGRGVVWLPLVARV